MYYTVLSTWPIIIIFQIHIISSLFLYNWKKIKFKSGNRKPLQVESKNYPKHRTKPEFIHSFGLMEMLKQIKMITYIVYIYFYNDTLQQKNFKITSLHMCYC